MIVRFLIDVDISDKIIVQAGQVFNAEEDEKFYYIDMGKNGVCKAPKTETDGILEVFIDD